jgi:3-hydroxyacyl-CoA dehydrogenase/enoyl-CoA hydratase/3-hydroxybutyryl-CoA epimerase
MMEQYEHWSWYVDDQANVWVEFDRSGRSANSINLEVLLELEHLIERLLAEAQKSEWKKLIFCSKKISGFIAGADIIDVFAQKDAIKTDILIEKGQTLFKKIERFPLPTVALIHGFCLGGGFELALACDWRIAIESPSLSMGLPEVLLGLQPGWGGSVRLPRLIGVKAAFEMILSGKTLKAPQIKKLKIADYVIPERLLAGTLAACQTKKQPTHWKRQWYWAFPPLRSLMGWLLRRALKSQKVIQAHYPAPFIIIDGWQRYGHLTQAAFDWEVRSLQALARTETTAHLVNVFKLRDMAKKSVDKKKDSIQKVHVIGAGVMGGDIAYWAAAQGYHVTLADLDSKKIMETMQRAQKWADKNIKKNSEKTAFFDRLTPDLKGLGVASADLIVEAVPENIDLKKKIISHIDKQARIDAVIATNTSTLPIESLSGGLKNPERLIGIHFFNPVPKMPLVEIIKSSQTAQSVHEKAMSWVLAVKKIPLAVTSTPGFFVNRVLLPYITQALVLMNDGYSKELIDKSAVDFGMPMGPLELADQVGLDVCAAALESMGMTLVKQTRTMIDALIEKGHLGKKTGQGLYLYKNGQPQRQAISNPARLSFCQDALIFALLNEIVQAWHAKIVSSQDEADLACLFGFGFPAFRGGPFVYIKEQGVEHLLQRFALFTHQIENWGLQQKAWLEIT